VIVDTLGRLALYDGAHPGIEAVRAFLRATELAHLAPGRHTIDGERLYALASVDQGRGSDGARLEAHRRYIDLQVVVAGQERMGWRALDERFTEEGPFEPARDIGFYTDRPTLWLDLRPGEFAIFFPTDAHAPLGGTGEVRKVVFKLSAAW
jgi:YhcH/YjgK/YiaL family protein